MKNLEQFDVMTDEALSTVEGGKSFFYDFGYWYGSHASLSNLANNLGRMLRSWLLKKEEVMEKNNKYVVLSSEQLSDISGGNVGWLSLVDPVYNLVSGLYDGWKSKHKKK